MKIKDIQTYLKNKGKDAWILVDYENKNPALVGFLGKRMLTRKIFAAIPSGGKPFLIVHQIDTVYLQDEEVTSNFDLCIYKTWKEMLSLERKLFAPYKRVLMDISENGLLPRVSLADYGSVEFIKSLGIEVSSSADLLQTQTSVLSEKSLQLQIKACNTCLKIKDEAFAFLAEKIRERGETSELEIQRFIQRRFDEEGMYYDEPPLVAIGPNASNPHYAPTAEKHSSIKRGDLVLIDMWAKYRDPECAYADITWMGYVGEDVPDIYKERFAIIKEARDAAISFLREQLPVRPVYAYEVDDVARKIIEASGYGNYFVHRLGHSIATDDSPHGPGANLDNYGSHDGRELIDGTSFSDEPGIYAPDFGMRTETDLHIENRELIVLAGLQEEVIPLLAKD